MTAGRKGPVDAPTRPQRFGQPADGLTTAPTGPAVIIDVETGLDQEGIDAEPLGSAVMRSAAAEDGTADSTAEAAVAETLQ